MTRTSILIYGAFVVACTDEASTPTPNQTGYVVSPADAPDLDPRPEVVKVRLRAAPMAITIDGHEDDDALAYEGQIPGPTIRAQVGDTIEVVIENATGAPTTVHWHGMHVPWEVDGATWRTQPIADGTTRLVSFSAESAGTFWYHPHFDSEREVDRGLYGALVVSPRDAVVDPNIEERVLVFDTWAERDATGGDDDDADDGHGHGGGIDDRTRAWIVNGLSDPTVSTRGGSYLHARLVNASNTGYLAVTGGDPIVIAHDQGLLGAPETTLPIILAPGDRVEVVWPIGESGFDVVTERYTMHGGAIEGTSTGHDGHDDNDDTGATTTARLFHVAVDDPRPAPPRTSLPWTFSRTTPTRDPGHTDITWVLQGTDLGWLINGESFPDVTIPSVALGTDVIIEVRNLSPTHHPFHLHGMAFEVLSRDGVVPTERIVEDTLDLPIRGVARLLVRADNSGEWMAHCHILPHAHGMMTILRVAPP